MSINERISLLEERVADILRTYDVLIAQHERLDRRHTELLDRHEALQAQVQQHRTETEASIGLLCSLIGISPDQLTSGVNLMIVKELLQKRANERTN